jgi:P27 family predicted phage terminase small subunit
VGIFQVVFAMTHDPKPPADLSREAKALWARIYAEVDLDSAAVLLLDTLCQQFDRMTAARQLVAKEGMVVEETTAAGNKKQRAHPACAIERDAAATMTRCWRLLGFDQMPVNEMGRPAGS